MNISSFIGCSSEALEWARAVELELSCDTRCNVWIQEVLPSRPFIESLLEQLSISDFGIFVCSADDMVESRDEKTVAVRDNVVFELGLYIGRLGLSRTFILTPDNVKVRLPSDLHGITTLRYVADRNPGPSQVSQACTAMSRQFKKQGPFRRDRISASVVDRLAIAVDRITGLLTNAEFLSLSDDERVAFATKRALAYAQAIADEEWGAGIVSVSLKQPDPARPKTHLQCYFNEPMSTAKYQPSGSKPMFDFIPIKRTIAGKAFNSGVRQCIPDVNQLAKNLIDPKVRVKMEGRIRSVLAEPICFGNGPVVAVIKLDSNQPGLFRDGCPRLQAVVRSISTCMDIAYRIGTHGNKKLEGLVTDGASAHELPRKRVLRGARKPAKK